MNIQKLVIKIKGMSCATCAISNEKELLKTKGILKAMVNFASKKAYIEYDADLIGENKIRQVIVENGYKIEISNKMTNDKIQNSNIEDGGHQHMRAIQSEAWMKNGKHEHGDEDTQNNWNMFLWSVILSIPLLVEMFVKLRTDRLFLRIDIAMWLYLFLATIVVFYFGWRFHKMALIQAGKLRANMDTLISLGTLTAYFYSLWAIFNGLEGYFETAAVIITLILLGKYFEAKSTGQASEAMKKLLELGVKKARILIDGEEREIDVSEIKIGDILIIRPSEKIPLDGEVVEGESNADESMLTGESLPIAKTKGSMVYGATINQDGVLKVKVTQIGEGTVLSQIIKTVEEAQGSKAPIQKLADKISGIFVPAVIFLAALTFLGWHFYAAPNDFTRATINAVAVLVIACPCALGLATPAAIMVGTSRGARQGILFKTGESFEKIKNISMIIFDKTGTLTQGKPRVHQIISNPSYNLSLLDKNPHKPPFLNKEGIKGRSTESAILKIAGSLAQNSEHPLSKAISDYVKDKNTELIASRMLDISGVPPAMKVAGFKEIKGKGLVGICSQHQKTIMLGNIKLLQENGVNTPWADKILSDKISQAGTTLFVAQDTNLIGAIIVADEIRPEAPRVINKIKKMGLKIAMITGDNAKTAQAVAEKLGIENIIADVLPQDKASEVKRLQEKGEKVIFVGDGINDAPSLVQADLGIAMGSATDIAKEAGQIILMQNNLEKVLEAILVSRLTFKTIKQNLFWAFFYNIVAIPLAMAGFLNPIIAAGAMAFSSASVVLNSLRINKKKQITLI